MAIGILDQVVNQYPNSPLKEKAATMIDVLQRRASIEAYLTNLKIERVKEDSQLVVYDSAMISKRGVASQVRKEPLPQNVQPVTVAPEKTVINPDKQLAPPVSNGTFTFDPQAPQYVVMILSKVDPVYINEAKNAFIRYDAEKFRLLNLQITRDTLDKDRSLLVFTQFENAAAAMNFVDKIRRDRTF